MSSRYRNETTVPQDAHWIATTLSSFPFMTVGATRTSAASKLSLIRHSGLGHLEVVAAISPPRDRDIPAGIHSRSWIARIVRLPRRLSLCNVGSKFRDERVPSGR